MHNAHHSSHGRPRAQLLVHPPFPSFAWVMTAQANPPTHAYAYGYVQNAHARTRSPTQMQTQVQTRLPASCAAATPHGHYRPLPRRSAKPLFPSPPPAEEAFPTTSHQTLMETVDYRYHDPPTRPYVPWRAGLASREMQILPPSAASPSRAKRRRLDSALRALRRACGLSKGTEPSRAA